MRLSRSFKLALALMLVVLALPASASAQATRTWVSGVGDDANPCSRTAPCKTLAGAQSKTAAGGQISGLDGGGFGAITINKSLTIDLRGLWEGGVLTNVSNGITVNAAATDRVKILGLNINGLNSNFHGIRILQARSVKISDVNIFGFNRNGVSVENANPLVRVVVKDSTIHDNGGNGVLVAPQGANAARVTVRNNDIDENGCGITGTRFGPDPAFNYASNCGTNNGGAGTGTVGLHTFRNGLTENTHFGLFSNGTTVRNRFGNNEIVGSDTGIAAINGGELISLRGNAIVGNHIANGAPTSTVDPV
ncbi:MAG: right-handed parallel beta-helix repeat-containing protein [Actinomycetota bacterium]|nr:right-handed parallel beta-helix repeat-containing protein [Actinomycetota bacterium]MDQ5808307.1 right-handed parallel beta-helix repeat-containing protein [Actinomycetota bacterium]